MTPQTIDDLELVRRAQVGDSESLATLADQVCRRVYAYIRRVTLKEDVAADLAQDTVVAVLNHLSGLRQHDRFWPWVFRIANNGIRQHYREESRRRASALPESMDWELPAGDRTNAVGAGEVDSELAEMTRAALAGVSDRHRAVLRLRFYEGLPHASIARFMNCSEAATRTALHRAKSALAHRIRRALRTYVNS